MLIIQILILITLFLLSKTHSYLYVPVINLSTKDNQKLSKLLRKGFERSVYSNEYKKKVRFKIQPMNIDIFSKSMESMDYLF